MTTRLEATVDLNLSAARQQLREFASEVQAAGGRIDVPLSIENEQALQDLRAEISAASGQVIEVDIDVEGGEEIEGNLQRSQQLALRFEDSLDGVASAASASAASLDRAEGESRDLAESLDIAEDSAAGVARNVRDVDNATKNADRSAQGLFRRFQNLQGTIGAVVGVLGIRKLVQEIGEAVGASQRLSESVNAVNVVFGEGAEEVLAFGENAASSVGLAASEFNQLVTPIGALLQNFGFSAQEAGQQAITLGIRAADLASVFNTDVRDALDAIGSALRGEVEPLRRYAANVDQATASAKALELGLAGSAAELTQNDIVAARLAVILEQTSVAAGDFARTSGESANAARIASAGFEELRAEIGNQLIPAYQEILAVAPAVTDAVGEVGPAFGFLASVIGESVGGLGEFVIAANAAVGVVRDLGAVAGFLPGLADGLEDSSTSAASLVSPLAAIGGLLEGIRVAATTGLSVAELADALDLVAARAADGVDPVLALQQGLAAIRDDGGDVVAVLDDLAAAAGASDEELATFVSNLIQNADDFNFTAEQVRELKDELAELTAVGERGEGLNFDRGGLGASFREAVPDVEALSRAVESLDLSGEFDEQAILRGLQPFINELPTVIRNVDDLNIAAADAGVSLSEFAASAPDNFTLDLSQADLELGALVDRLREGAEALGTNTLAAFDNLSELINEETGELTTDTDTFIEALADAAQSAADFDANIGTLQLRGFEDLAALLAEQGPEIAAGIAEAFVLDEAAATAAQEQIDGTAVDLATDAATRFAEAYAEATPEQIAELQVFGASNFISNAVRQDLRETGLALADEIVSVTSDALRGRVITPELIIDLSNATISGLASGSAVLQGGQQGGSSVTVNINNATTEDIDTSANQAAQTIGTVSDLISGAIE